MSEPPIPQPESDDFDAIEAQARAWVLRLNDPDAHALASECRTWRQADPRHDAAFLSASRTWSALGRTALAQSEAWRAEASAAGPRVRLRRWAPPAGLAAGLALAVLIVPLAIPQPGATYTTKVAETRRLDLADGSRVFMGARSAVKVRVDGGGRQVELKDGEAFFEVAKDPARPFYVVAGDTTVRVVGTKFDVRRVGDEVKVAVMEGRVEVIWRTHVALVVPEVTKAVLTPGEQINIERHASSSAKPTQVGASIPGAWREGRLLYADAPLRDVIADANRYSPNPIRLASADLGELRVTATFRTNATTDLIANLEHGLPVRAEQESDGSIVLIDARGTP